MWEPSFSFWVIHLHFESRFCLFGPFVRAILAKTGQCRLLEDVETWNFWLWLIMGFIFILSHECPGHHFSWDPLRCPFTAPSTRGVESREAHADLAVAINAFGKGLCAYTRQSKDIRTSVAKKFTDLNCNPADFWWDPHSLQPQKTNAQQLFQACCRSGRNTPLNKAGGQEIHHTSEARRPALEGEQLIYHQTKVCPSCKP